jgi:hypothetical protein
VTIGGVPRGAIRAAAEQGVLPPFPLEHRDEMRLLEDRAGRVDALTVEPRRAMDGCADEAATRHVHAEVVRGAERQRWMVRARLEPQ